MDEPSGRQGRHPDAPGVGLNVLSDSTGFLKICKKNPEKAWMADLGF